MQELKKLKKIFSYYLFIIILLLLSNKITCLELKGNFIQGGLLIGKASADDIIYFNDSLIPVDETGEFIIGLGRKQPINNQLRIEMKNGEVRFKNIVIEARKYEIQKINNLSKDKVSPPKEFYKRIESEIKRIKKAKAISINYSHYREGFIMPAKGIITGVYGSQRVLNGVPKRPHYGLDIANKQGSPVLAPSDGVIVLVEKDLFFSGATIIISHGRGLTSSLLHLKEILVEEGMLVKKGHLVGLMGDTGRATGSHLDWRMELRGIRIDPYLLIYESER